MSALDPELPSIFIRQALQNPDARWKAPFGGWSDEQFAAIQAAGARVRGAVAGRFGTVEGVDSTSPYVVWNVRDDPTGTVRCGTGERDEVVRKRAIVLVKRVDVFTSGRGSFSPQRPTYADLYFALIGVPKTPIWSDGGFGGVVTQSRFRRDHRVSNRDPQSNALVCELGFEFELTYENN